MNVVILGPQGSGKGTQAKLLADKYGFTHIETGEILREIATTDHPWGKRIKDMMQRGVLVSDDILAAVLKESLKKPAKSGYIFDGTPRNLIQFELINEILATYGQKIDKVVLINLGEKETIHRLMSRRTCKNCGRIYNLVTNPPPDKERCECMGVLIKRDDDVPNSIKKRLEAFWNSTEKVVKTARDEGILIEVNGERPIAEIEKDIAARLELCRG